MFNCPISDLVAILRNGYLANKKFVTSPVSKLRGNVLRILKKEGYIASYSVSDNLYTVSLKYSSFGPAISSINVVSKPSRRFYSGYDSMPVIKNGLGMALVSTSKGVMSSHDAYSLKIGGEILLKIF